MRVKWNHSLSIDGVFFVHHIEEYPLDARSEKRVVYMPIPLEGCLVGGVEELALPNPPSHELEAGIVVRGAIAIHDNESRLA